MARVLRRLATSYLLPNPNWNPIHYEQTRLLKIGARNGNVKQALSIMERRMKQSGMQRYKDHEVHHMKNSEKRILVRKKLQIRIRS